MSANAPLHYVARFGKCGRCLLLKMPLASQKRKARHMREKVTGVDTPIIVDQLGDSLTRQDQPGTIHAPRPGMYLTGHWTDRPNPNSIILDLVTRFGFLSVESDTWSWRYKDFGLLLGCQRPDHRPRSVLVPCFYRDTEKRSSCKKR